MVEIGKNEYKLLISDRKRIKERLIKHTCKTNLSPHLLFTNMYTENTSRVFIGNWTKDGFWITRYRRQFINFRADVVAEGVFKEKKAYLNLKFQYSLGFSSIITGLFIILFIGIILTYNGLNYFIAMSIPAILYGLFTYIEVVKAKKAIHDYLLNEYSK